MVIVTFNYTDGENIGELLEVSIISGLFGIIGLMILNYMWFKKENFKLNKTFQRKKLDLEFKKLSRDMGLTSSSSFKKTPSTSSLNSLVTPELIAALAKKVTGEEGEEGGELPTGLDGIIQWALENPDNPIVKAFKEGFLGKKENENEETPAEGFL